MEFPVTYERTIRFSDTDAQGVVFNANYHVYFDDTLTDYLEAAGLAWSELTRRGVDLLLARTEVDFRSSARIGETLVTGARVTSIGRSSMQFEVASWDRESGREVATATLVQVMVDTDTHRSTPVPDWFTDAVRRFQSSSVDRRPPSDTPRRDTSPRSTSSTLDPDTLGPR